MPIDERQYNGILFDQLSIPVRIETATEDKAAPKQIAMERRQIGRKLYQATPLIEGAK